GHGQHQFAGYIAPLAVKTAADATQCKDSGAAWQVLKFYVSQSFRSTAEPTLKINTGEYDFLLGRSYFEIAMEGRSQHKTQEQGVLELRGERFSGLNLIESKVLKVEKETSVFDGIADSSETAESARRALKEYEPTNPQKIVPILIEGWQAVRQSKDKSYLLGQFSEAIRRASGIVIDALADKETVAPEESFRVTSKVFFPNAENVKIKEIRLQTPNDWQVSKADAPKEDTQGFFRREVAGETAYFNVKVPKNTKPTQPFWLENERNGDLFDLQTAENLNQPFQKPLIFAEVKIEINGTEINLIQPVQYRFADDIRGEVRRDLNVVPKLSLSLDQNLLIVPYSDTPQTRKIVLNVKNNSSTVISGTTDLKLPDGWKTKQDFGIFQLSKKGESKSFEFDVVIPAKFKISDFELGAQVTGNGEIFTQTMREIAYPHITTHRFYTTAKAKINVLDLKVAPVKIGYIAGSGDNVAEAIRQMGLSVTMLDEKELNNGDLARFDVIVVGIRASEVREDFVAYHQRLLDYVKDGGNLIVQYQRPTYQNLLPFPAKLEARVTDENAKVTILDATNPIFNFPNKITKADFQGWVQERNLYAFSTFDAKYKPLLEAHDAGEPENKGGLVITEIGKGKYIYCSYAFFRQLPAGVSGAYRLFANLLSLPKAK
ncbi:MAG: hypothetical protein M3Q33_10665, partial [Acidobacteriota bacterium]|nr:hypothetical protein [Acidobacteriota bacterium]